MAEKFEKIQEAFQLTLCDSKSKYDESMVARLYECVSTIPEDEFYAINELLDRTFINDNFKDLKLYRLLRLQKIVVSRLKIIDQKDIDRLSRLTRVVLEDGDEKSLTDLIDLLLEYMNLDFGYQFIVTKLFQEPFVEVSIHKSDKESPSPFKISNALDLARYAYEKSRNYHVLEKARVLLKALIEKSFSSATDCLFSAKVRLFVEDMLISGNLELSKCVLAIVSNPFIQEQMRPMIQKSFEKAVRFGDASNISLLAALMSRVTNIRDAKYNLALLRKMDNFGAIISYITHNIDLIEEPAIIKYLAYPILSKLVMESQGECIEQIQLLGVTEKERQFMDNHECDKHLLICLRYLKDVAANLDRAECIKRKRKHIVKMLIYDHLNRIAMCMILYLKYNQKSPGAYKNILSCVDALEAITVSGLCDLDVTIFIMNEIYNFSEKLNGEKSTHVVIITRYVKLLNRNLKEIAERKESAKDFCKFIDKVVCFGLSTENCDILNEIVALLSENCFPQLLRNGDQQDGSCGIYLERYVELLWNHIRVIALDQCHQDLLGSCTDLLIEIDLYVNNEIFADLKIQRHIDIPKHLNQVLSDYTGGSFVIEALVERMRYPVRANIKMGQDLYSGCTSYLCFLSHEAALDVQISETFDQIIKAFCSLARGDYRESTRLDILRELGDLITELDSCDKIDVLRRIVRLGLPQTLHDLSTNTMDPGSIRRYARNLVTKLKMTVFDHSSMTREVILKIFLDEGGDTAGITKCVDLYLSGPADDFISDSNDGCKITFDTYLDNIITQQHRDAYVLECD